MGDTCFPSHLPTSSLCGGVGGWGGDGGGGDGARTILFCLFPASNKKGGGKCRRAGEKAKFVHRGGKLISKVKRKECVPLKNEKKESRSAFELCSNSTLQRMFPFLLRPTAETLFVIQRRQICCWSNCENGSELCEPTLPPCG